MKAYLYPLARTMQNEQRMLCIANWSIAVLALGSGWHSYFRIALSIILFGLAMAFLFWSWRASKLGVTGADAPTLEAKRKQYLVAATMMMLAAVGVISS